MTEAIERQIFIDAIDGQFAVTVEPPPAGQSYDDRFPTHRAARGWAGGCRLNFGWRIIDRTCGLDAPAQQRG